MIHRSYLQYLHILFNFLACLPTHTHNGVTSHFFKLWAINGTKKQVFLELDWSSLSCRGLFFSYQKRFVPQIFFSVTKKVCYRSNLVNKIVIRSVCVMDFIRWYVRINDTPPGTSTVTKWLFQLSHWFPDSDPSPNLKCLYFHQDEHVMWLEFWVPL